MYGKKLILENRGNKRKIEYWQCLVNIENLYEIALTQLIDKVQFYSIISHVSVVNVPLIQSNGNDTKNESGTSCNGNNNGNSTSSNTFVSIPLFVSENNTHDKSMYDYAHYFCSDCNYLRYETCIIIKIE